MPPKRGNQKPKGKAQPKRKNPSQKKEKAYNRMRDQQAQRWRAEAPQKQVGAAAAYATGQAGRGAKVMATRDRCTVSHREFIGNVTGTTAFTVAQAFALNPGLATSFPWLSSIANSWETYRFKKLRVCYYTRTGSNVPGSVIMAHDPDSSDAAPSSEQIMTTYDECREDAPWKDICLVLKALDLREGQARKFVRSAALAANEDIKLYDSGNLYIGTVDGTAVNWGKLWFEYDVEFQTPQLPPAGLPATGISSATYTNVSGTGVAAATPFGTGGATLPATASSLISGVAAKVLSMANLVIGGEYQITYASSTTTGGSTNANFSAATGGSITTQLVNTSASAPNSMSCTFTAAATTGSVTVNVTFAGTTTNVFVSVCQIPVSALLAQPALVPEETREERRARLLNELSALSRSDRELRDASPSRNGF